MGAEYAITIAAVLMFIFIAIGLYAAFKISSEQSRWEEGYRNKKKGKKNAKTKS